MSFWFAFTQNPRPAAPCPGCSASTWITQSQPATTRAVQPSSTPEWDALRTCWCTWTPARLTGRSWNRLSSRVSMSQTPAWFWPETAVLVLESRSPKPDKTDAVGNITLLRINPETCHLSSYILIKSSTEKFLLFKMKFYLNIFNCNTGNLSNMTKLSTRWQNTTFWTFDLQSKKYNHILYKFWLKFRNRKVIL